MSNYAERFGTRAAAIFAGSRATGRALLVQVTLAYLADSEGVCRSPVREIAALSRLSVRMTQHYLAALVALGEIDRRYVQGEACETRVTPGGRVV